MPGSGEPAESKQTTSSLPPAEEVTRTGADYAVVFYVICVNMSSQQQIPFQFVSSYSNPIKFLFPEVWGLKEEGKHFVGLTDGCLFAEWVKMLIERNYF